MIRLGDIILHRSDLACHLAGRGESGSGKSKCIEAICRALASYGETFIFLDPHGSTVWDLLNYFAFYKVKNVRLLDTSRRDRIVGLCPFYSASKDSEILFTAAESITQATLKAWGHDPMSTPRLTKWLRRLYFTLLEQDLAFADVDYFLKEATPQRAKILKNCSLRQEWEALYKKKGYDTYIESTESRLEMFRHPQLRRILSLKENSIDLERLWDKGGILLVNSQPSPVMDEQTNRVSGALLINQLTQIALQKKKPRRRLYLVLDECYKFITPDFRSILDEARKRQLSMLAFYQRTEQLDRDTASALENAKTKLIFSTKDSPKKERHFDYIGRDGTSVRSVMQTVFPCRVKVRKLERYIQAILQDFMTLDEVDRRLNTTSYEKELDEHDFGR